jgi:hypothetical protein
MRTILTRTFVALAITTIVGFAVTTLSEPGSSTLRNRSTHLRRYR